MLAHRLFPDGERFPTIEAVGAVRADWIVVLIHPCFGIAIDALRHSCFAPSDETFLCRRSATNTVSCLYVNQGTLPLLSKTGNTLRSGSVGWYPHSTFLLATGLKTNVAYLKIEVRS